MMAQRQQHISPFIWVTAALTVLMAGALSLNAKIIADGYQSHAVSTRLKIAQYKWLTGNARDAADTLWRTAPLALEAGLRWQLAQRYFSLAGYERGRSNLAQARQLCLQALQALDFGRFDHTRNGTSTTLRKCDGFGPPP